MATMNPWEQSAYGAVNMAKMRDASPQADQDAKLLHHLLESMTNQRVDVIREHAMNMDGGYSWGGQDRWRVVFRDTGYNVMIGYSPDMSQHMEGIARDCVKSMRKYDKDRLQAGYDAAMQSPSTSGTTATEIKIMAQEAQMKVMGSQGKLTKTLEKELSKLLAPSGYRAELQARVDNWLN